MAMTIKLYDLAGAEEHRRFSPFCWRTKMALAHKGLAFETIPWHFTETAAIAAHGSERVPVIIDNGRAVNDSWTIANYLEDTYPDLPSLFGGHGGCGAARLINAWTDNVINTAIGPMIILDVLQCLAPRDRDYFRASREPRYGMRLEEIPGDRDARVQALRKLFEPLRQTLAAQPFIGGDTPLYPDYIVFGTLQWPRATSPLRLLEASDPVEAWRQRLLDCFSGLARSAPGYW
jgi:glutathione S-transferase